jgi:hypothetical protein
MFKNSIGFVNFGSLGRNLFYEFQLFALIRDFKDGIRFFEIKINWDRYKSDHTPAFQIEITILNLYNHFWLYQNNYTEDDNS